MREKNFANYFDKEIKDEVVKKLNPRNITNSNVFTCLKPVYEQVYQLLENTFKFREGKSTIVIGPRGIGKTFIVEKAIDELKNIKKYEFFTIRLNGSFFRDDAKAIKEIARQLDWYLEKYNPNERDNLKRATFEQSSVTGTMNVIIDILDRTRLSEENEEIIMIESDDETIVGVNTKTKNTKKKPMVIIPIVFIIDEIDKYTHNAKQTLLYNLFDMAQSSSSKTDGQNLEKDNKGGTTISVIGLSTKTTVREQLEKRVKSRFSQRIIQINKVKELESFCDCVYELISINESNNSFRKEYNEFVKMKINENGGELRKLIVQNFYTIKDLPGLRNELIIYIMTKLNKLIYQHMKDYLNRNLLLIRGLSESEIKLLICCCRAKLKNNVSCINFEMAFEEYYNMMMIERREIQSKIQVAGMSLQESEGTYLLDRNAMQICWERLCLLGLLERQTVSSYNVKVSGNIDSDGKADWRGKGGNSFLKTNGNYNFRNNNNITGHAGSMTPGGIAVCGVELDDIVLENWTEGNTELDTGNENGWLARWKRL